MRDNSRALYNKSIDIDFKKLIVYFFNALEKHDFSNETASRNFEFNGFSCTLKQ